MGVFDFLFRRARRSPLTAEQLRDRLFNAAAAHDAAALAELCSSHEDAVLASFAGWQRVPEAFRVPDKLAWYAPGLIAVARHFAEERGHPELLQRMIGAPGANPLIQWQRTLAEVEPMMAEHRYEEAATRLQAALESGEHLQGSGVDSYLPVTYGRLGECLLQSGDAEGARAPMERALARCEATGDVEGILTYLGNCYEIHRYRGDSVAAADSLDRRGAVLDRRGRDAEAARSRRQASIVRAGEPLCRVVVEIGDETMELSDLSSLRGSVRFVFARNRLALRRSTDAVARGVKAAQRGELEAALGCFERARAADAFDPWPRYHAGLALMELRRYDDAAASYQATEALAPGWYYCRADRWLAERMAAGVIDHETFSLVRQLDDGELPAARVAALAEAALQRGELGVLYLLLGDALDKLDRDAEAAEAYRRGLAIAEEPDIRTRLLVALGLKAKDPLERTQRLHEAIDLSGNLMAAAMAAVVLTSNPAAARA
jgi:tetratricopeptide (TPR) repeat protein